MFEKEAEEYRKDLKSKFFLSEPQLDLACQGFKDGYNKAKEETQAQIEKMKCGGNCKHLYHINTGGCYDAKCDLTYCDCINCKDKWELRG